MAESKTSTFNSLTTNPKRMYLKQRDNRNGRSIIPSSKNSINMSIPDTSDWHRVLFTRLKPGVTGKYRTTRRNGNKSDAFSPLIMEDSTVTLQSYSDESFTFDNHSVIITQLDTSRQVDFSDDHLMRKENHYVKNSTSNRSDDHMTSLKRRVRKQQKRHFQNSPTILQESTYQLPSQTDLFLMSCSEQNALPRRRSRSKKSTCVVSLPPLAIGTRVISNRTNGLALNIYGC